jgi:hypothetical protein
MSLERTVFYCAQGEACAAMAQHSIESLRGVGAYDGPITAFTDCPYILGGMAEIREIPAGRPGWPWPSRESKIGGWQSIDATVAAYLDCDTEALGPIAGIFDLPANGIAALRRWPQFPTFGESRLSKRLQSPIFRQDLKECAKVAAITDATPHYNGGVIVARVDAFRPIAARWLSEWQKIRYADELALMRALVGQTGIVELDAKFNSHVPGPSVAIYHYYCDQKKRRQIAKPK